MTIQDKKIEIIIGLFLLAGIIVWFLFPIVNAEDIYIIESGSSGNTTGETTQCINIGNGTKIILNSTSGNCFVKTLVAGNDITITNTTNTITITSSGTKNIVITNTDISLTINEDIVYCIADSGDVTITLPATSNGKEYTVKRDGALSSFDCILDISGSGTFDDGNNFIILSQGFDSITVVGISSNLWGAVSSLAECQDIGTGGIDICVLSSDIPYILMRGVSSGTGISVASVSNNAQVTNTLPEATTASNLGVNGFSVFSSEVGNDLQFKKLTASIVTGIDIISNSTSLELHAFAPWQIIGILYQSLVKTNIGTAYIDIYTVAFNEENMMVIDCDETKNFRIVYIWDYVGTGTQQLRWVNVANNANILYESPTFTTDRDGIDSGAFVTPSWCSGTVTIEQQAKSTVATDDPVAKGYKIMVR